MLERTGKVVLSGTVDQAQVLDRRVVPMIYYIIIFVKSFSIKKDSF